MSNSTTNLPKDNTTRNILSRLEKARRSGKGWIARCPAHDDRRESLSVGTGTDGRTLLKCHAGCTAEAVVSAIGLSMSDLFADAGRSRRKPKADARRIVATYDYLAENGELAFQVVRRENKTFWQRRPDPDKPGQWIANLEGVPRVLYRLPELLASATDPKATVYVVEGEKDCDRLRELGLVATCNPHGAGKWREEYSESLRGRNVVILPDNDKPGHEHAEAVARSLRGVAASVKVLELAELATHGDVSDWLDAGGTVDQLEQLTAAAPEWEPTPEAEQGTPPARWHRTDAGNAEALRSLFGEKLMYAHDLGHWLAWDERRWTKDADGLVSRLALETARLRYAGAPDLEEQAEREREASWAMKSESAAKLEAGLRIAKNLEGIAVTSGILDTDPWALNTRNGTLRLNRKPTGDSFFKPHCPSNNITKLAPVEWDPEATCPAWDRFLLEVFAGDTELIEFMRRAVGYSLTGSTREQVFFVCYGTGCNGKSTFLDLLGQVAGDYASATAMRTFSVEAERDSIRNDLARLRGVRLVSAVEASKSLRLAEGTVKHLTGEHDRVVARFLYAEPFEFKPAFKVWLACNHRPTIRDTSPAMWRRVRLIPFTVSFEGREDRDRAEKLKAELAGILTWAITGALQWRREGLKSPTSVLEATAVYRAESDLLEAFLADCAELERSAEVKASELYKAFKDWCESNGERSRSNRAFGTAMSEKGFARERRNDGYWYVGLRLEGV